MERSNLFNPFDSRSIQHEDRLTWAFLIALKYDPSLQNFLRELVESRIPSEHREYSNSWEPARVSTQTKWIESTTNLLVSVLLTDARIQEAIRVEWSDREPRYDGVIEYPNGLTLVVENKPFHGNVWEEQLSPSRDSFPGDVDDVTLHGSAICLEWSEVLEGVLKYADSSIASFSSREIARDFLSFVEEVHPELTPYRTFRLCRDRHEVLRRRTIRLLDNLASRVKLESREGWYLFRPGKIAERVMIQVESRKLKVELAPADTVWQARRFYNVVDKAAFLSLKEWKVEPNLHFSFIQNRLVRAKTTLEIQEYMDYFSDDASYGQRPADPGLWPYIELWEYKGFISSENGAEIEAQFINTDMNHINITPGFSISREWDLDTVIKLEERGELEACIIDALATPLATWGETL